MCESDFKDVVVGTVLAVCTVMFIAEIINIGHIIFVEFFK